ncbi:MAG TPA: phosphoglycerate kinase [Polyangiaceae bacterium]|nr:phosphoglycerate kinase [Polyangiaceae bacterium]
MSLLAGIGTLDDLDLSNQRVFVRLDLDVPLAKSGEAVDDARLQAALPTLRKLLDSGARVVVGARFGELRTGQGGLPMDQAPSIEPVGARLAELLGVEVFLPDGCSGDSVKRVITNLRERQLCLLENLASDEDAGSGAEAFARVLFEQFDMYVGDAPRALSFESATTTILPRLFERRVMGELLRRELAGLVHFKSGGARRRLFIWGGSSLSERLPLLHKLLGPTDRVYLVGVAANTMARALGGTTGRSTVEETYLAGARTLADQLGDRLLLPSDYAVADSVKATESRVAPAGQLRPDDLALDLGPNSRDALAAEIAAAPAVLWCGAAGFHRNEAFAAGTRAIARALAETSAFTLVAGDDSVAAVQAVGAEFLPGIDLVSAGGQSSLALLSDNKLPGLEALRGIVNDSKEAPDRR